MKKILVILWLCLNFTFNLVAQFNDYSNPTDQKALKAAVEIIKKFYPENDICISDTIQCSFLAGGQVDHYTDSILSYLNNEKISRNYKPIVSKYISTIFPEYTCNCGNYKYIIMFNEPYNQIIQCDVVPLDRPLSYSNTCVVGFLFRYNISGEIIQIYKSEILLF